MSLVPVLRRPITKPAFSRVRANPTEGSSPWRPAGVDERPDLWKKKKKRNIRRKTWSIYLGELLPATAQPWCRILKYIYLSERKCLPRNTSAPSCHYWIMCFMCHYNVDCLPRSALIDANTGKGGFLGGGTTKLRCKVAGQQSICVKSSVFAALAKATPWQNLIPAKRKQNQCIEEGKLKKGSTPTCPTQFVQTHQNSRCYQGELTDENFST